MPVPKYKRTAYRSKQQTAAWRKKILERLENYLHFVPCPNCGTAHITHTVCIACAGGTGAPVKSEKAEVAVQDKQPVEAVVEEKEEGKEKGAVADAAAPVHHGVEPKMKDLGKIKEGGDRVQEHQHRYQRKAF